MAVVEFCFFEDEADVGLGLALGLEDGVDEVVEPRSDFVASLG